MKTKLLADFQTCASIPCEYEYDDVLFNEKIMRHKMERIQSKLHKFGTYNVWKISLSCFDDKRYNLNGGITTLANVRKDLKD